MDPEVHTDTTGTFHLTPTGTGIKFRTGGLSLDDSTPVAGQLTGATVASPVLSGTVTGTYALDLGAAAGNDAGPVVSVAIKFDVTDGHDAAVGTSTGTVELPAGAILLNIQVVSTVTWNAGDSAVLDVGDDDAATGWFSQVNVQDSAELEVGEVLDISNAENWGAAQGAYLNATSGRKGRTTAGVDSGVFYGAASQVIGALTTAGTVPSTGTTYMIVTYMKPTQ